MRALLRYVVDVLAMPKRVRELHQVEKSFQQQVTNAVKLSATKPTSSRG